MQGIAHTCPGSSVGNYATSDLLGCEFESRDHYIYFFSSSLSKEKRKKKNAHVMENDLTVDEGKERLDPSREKNKSHAPQKDGG